MPPAKSQLGRNYLDSCARYDTVIPNVHCQTTIIFITEEPQRFDTVVDRILLQLDRVFTRHIPASISDRPWKSMSRKQLATLKWAIRLQDEYLFDSIFFITKKFSHSDAPCDLPVHARHDILLSEPWISNSTVHADSVRCAGCQHKIRFDHPYSVLEWVAHRDMCQGIEHQMIQAVFEDWADATDENDDEIPEELFDRPYQTVLQSFSYPLRYVRMPDEDEDDGDYDYDASGSDAGTSEDSDWDEECSTFTALDTLEEDFISRDATYVLADVVGSPPSSDGEEHEDCSSTDYESGTDEADDESSPPGASNNGSSGPTPSSPTLAQSDDDDGPPRWHDPAAYHPGYYDGVVAHDEGGESEEEEEVQYISYEEHLRLSEAKTNDTVSGSLTRKVSQSFNAFVEEAGWGEFGVLFKKTLQMFD